MSEVRSRIRSHLTALSAASVIVACNHRACGKTDGGYGVVDPMPTPSCLDKGMPTATAEYVMVPGEGGVRRAVRVNVQLDIDAGVVGTASVTRRGKILEQKQNGNGLELLVLLEPDTADADAGSRAVFGTYDPRPGSVEISIGVSCSLGPSSFFVRVPLEPDGGAAPVADVSRW